MTDRRIPALLALVAISVGACGPSPSDQAKAGFAGFHRALRAKDLEAARTHLAREHAAELLDPANAPKLELAIAMMPPEVEITAVNVSGAEATLDVRGRNDGALMTGKVTMRKEDGAWKVAKEDWSMELSAASFGADSPGSAFLSDPSAKPEVYRSIEGHQDEVSALEYTPDGRWLVSASYGDYTLRVWDPETGEMAAEAKTDDRITDLAIAPDDTIYTADAYKHVLAWKWDGTTLAVDRTVVAEGGVALALSRDGRTLATTGHGSATRLWSFDGKPGATLETPENQRCAAFLPDGRALATAGDGNTYSVVATGSAGFGGWLRDLVTRDTKKISEVSKDSGVLDLDLSRDGKWLATAHGDSSLVIVDLPRRKEVRNFFVRDSPAKSLRFSPDGRFLATANSDRRVYVWESATGRGVATLFGHRDAPTAIAWSPDGRTLAVGDAERKILLWRCGLPEGSALKIAAAGKDAPPPAEPDRVTELGRENLISNPRGNQEIAFWRRDGDARVSRTADGDAYFELRFGGSLTQTAALPQGSDGKWALLVAWASSGRVEENGDQTGLPYLYGNTVDRADDHHFFGYVNDATMTLRSRGVDEWGTIWGLEQVPAGCGGIRLQLEQADGSTSQNGSAARFDDVGVFLFDTEAEAQEFLGAWERGRTQRVISTPDSGVASAGPPGT